jgi:glycosyltransferase involved in cell wall biosynthesis
VLGPGDPHYARDLRERGATIPGLALHFHGAYEPAELAGLLGDVDCVIAPSQWPETFLLVTREAMAHGVPIIVTRLGALPDAVADGVNGLTFDHDRPDQLAAQLKRLAEDAELLRRLRRGAAETPVLTMAEHAGVIRALYRQAMEDLAGRLDAPRGNEDDDDGELAFMHSALLGAGAGDVAV